MRLLLHHFFLTRLSVAMVAVFLFSTAAYAQSPNDNLFRTSMVTTITAHGMDLATTENCIGAKRCTEMNPFLVRFDEPIVFGAVKMGFAAGSLWLTAELHESHPRIATIINFVITGVFSGVAIHNYQVSKRK